MNIEPCPYCINNSNEYNNTHKPFASKPREEGYEGLSAIECPNCGACGPYRIGELYAAEAWNEVYRAVASTRQQKTELEAYRALSGGKTAMDYAEWLYAQRRIIKVAFAVMDEIRSFFSEDNIVNYPNRDYLIGLVDRWHASLDIKDQ